MTLREVAAAFDQISAAYDATRDPLDPSTLAALGDRLQQHGVRRVLEIGVGTGRIARPLNDRGIEVTGIDASRSMLAVARSKGVPRLVRGNAYHLPFPDGAFDATLFVHVLHILDRRGEAIAEAERVGRHGAYALVHPGRGSDERAGAEESQDPRRIVYRYLAEAGYPVPRGSEGPRARERRLLAELPPDELVVISDREVTEPLALRLRMLEQRASRHTLSIPPDVLRRATEKARAELGDRTVTFRRVEALAHWSRPLAEVAGTGPSA
jgi:ubiquinone/menaquinone biosynthesis C-methylase UbiE